MSNSLRRLIRILGPRRSVLLILLIVAGPTIEAWWGMFFEGPMVPTVIDKLDKRDLAVGQALVLLLPTFALVMIGIFLYSQLKPTRPFIAGHSVAEYQFEKTSRTVNISNGAPDIFHGCYGEIREFTRVLGGPILDMPKRGDRLVWNMYGIFRESVSIPTLGSENLVIAKFDQQQPDSFQIPIGLSTVRNIERSGSYHVTVEVGSEQSASTPVMFQFTITTEGEGISFSQVDSA